MVKKNIKTATIKQKYTKHNMVKKNRSNNQTKLHKTQQGKQKKIQPTTIILGPQEGFADHVPQMASLLLIM